MHFKNQILSDVLDASMDHGFQSSHLIGLLRSCDLEGSDTLYGRRQVSLEEHHGACADVPRSKRNSPILPSYYHSCRIFVMHKRKILLLYYHKSRNFLTRQNSALLVPQLQNISHQRNISHQIKKLALYSATTVVPRHLL